MARIVIEAPDEYKPLLTAVEEMVTTVVDAGARGSGGKAVDYARVEREVGRVWISS